MGTAKIDIAPFLLATSAVIATEAAARWLHTDMDPYLVTGIARIIDVASILVIFCLFDQGAGALGLSFRRIWPGFKKGVIWSAVFGMVSVVVGAGLLLAGMAPFRLIHVHLPESTGRLVLLYGVGCTVGPLAEEVFFRGMIYGFIRGRWGVWIGILASTLLFVAAHQQASGIPLPQLVGGVVFCLAYEYGRSLMTPILIHCLGNLALFTVSSLIQYFPYQ